MNTTTSNGPSAEQVTELCKLLEAGLPLNLAANSVGVTEATLREWMLLDPELEIRTGAAEAKFQMQCITAILSARDRKGNVNVRAVMWLLEARFPEQYGRKKASKPGSKKQVIDEIAVQEAAPRTAETLAEPNASIAAPLSVVPKVGRNEACPCGSGHKYKHCCGATNERTRRTGLKSSISNHAMAA